MVVFNGEQAFPMVKDNGWWQTMLSIHGRILRIICGIIHDVVFIIHATLRCCGRPGQASKFMSFGSQNNSTANGTTIVNFRFWGPGSGPPVEEILSYCTAAYLVWTSRTGVSNASDHWGGICSPYKRNIFPNEQFTFVPVPLHSSPLILWKLERPTPMGDKRQLACCWPDCSCVKWRGVPKPFHLLPDGFN